MDDLIKQLTQQTGINAEQARKVVETVSKFLKDKLPAPIASQVDAVLSGKIDPMQAAQSLSSLLGKK